MILWTIKLLGDVRQAIAGRNHPYQLAWAVAFGLVLGMVPHGNLVAFVWLMMVLSLNLNHSMAAVTAIGSSFAAGFLDPYSHRLGEFLLGQPRFRHSLADAWQWPLVPWTELNNTIVLGSLVIGVGALLPVFLVTYPIFRLLSRRGRNGEPDRSPPPHESHEVVVIDPSHTHVARPHRKTNGVHDAREAMPAAEDFVPLVDGDAFSSDDANVGDELNVAVETRIDVIRLADYREAWPAKDASPAAKYSSEDLDDQEPMDEAFRYLLRQLRDSQQRKAA